MNRKKISFTDGRKGRSKKICDESKRRDQYTSDATETNEPKQSVLRSTGS